MRFEGTAIPSYIPAVLLLEPESVKILPAYTVAEAARYVGVSPSTLQRWFRGKSASSTAKGGFRKSAVKPVLPTDAGPREPLSFIDLIEAHVLLSIRKAYNFPMRKIRTAMDYLAESQGNLICLAHKDFYHDNRELYLGHDQSLLSLSERGQLVDKTIMENGLHQIRYGKDGYADEFFPKMGDYNQESFVVNPNINYGRISLARIGVGADALARRYQAHEKIESIAEDYGATSEEIVEAIRWHDRLAA